MNSIFAAFSEKPWGYLPIEYLNEYRIRQAKHLLKDSDLPVTEVCLDCGYNNMGNFLREFAANIPIPLRLQYRKQAQ